MAPSELFMVKGAIDRAGLTGSGALQTVEVKKAAMMVCLIKCIIFLIVLLLFRFVVVVVAKKVF
jgi:hypothetical protein